MLSGELPEHHFTLRARLLRIIEKVEDNANYLPDTGRGFDISVLIDHKEHVHEIGADAQGLYKMINR